MATVLNDLGARNSGVGELSNFMKGRGDEAIQNRELMGQAAVEQAMQYAQGRGISLGQAMEENPSLKNSLYTGLLYANRGNKAMTQEMYDTLGKGKPTADQMFNYQTNKALDSIDPDMPLFDEVTVKKQLKQAGYTDEQIGQQFTAKDLQGISNDMSMANFWTPIAERLGFKPINNDPENPIWPPEFDKVRENMLQTYSGGNLGLADFKQNPAKYKPMLKQAMSQGKVMTDFLDEIATNSTGGPNSLAVAANVPPGAEGTAMGNFALQIDKPGKISPNGVVDVQATPILEKTGLNNQARDFFKGDKELPVRDTTGQLFVDPNVKQEQLGVAQPTGTIPDNMVMYSSPSRTVEVPPQWEETSKTVKGWFTTRAEMEDKIRKQGQEAAQRSIVSDVDLRDAEATINAKDAQTRLYGAQYMSTLAQLQAMEAGGGMTEQQKISAELAKQQTQDLFKAQLSKDFGETLKTEADLDTWNAMVGNAVKTWDDLGYELKLQPYSGKGRWWEGKKDVYTIGGAVPKQAGAGQVDLSPEQMAAYLAGFTG
jgi:hypothetical protein